MLILLISFLSLADFKIGMIVSFLLGAARDLWTGNALGITSFKLLIIALLVNLYRRKVEVKSFRYLVPFSFIVLSGWKIVELKGIRDIGGIFRINFWESLKIIPVFWVFKKIWKVLFTKEKILN